jgi:Zn-dependent membrane protease YugP
VFTGSSRNRPARILFSGDCVEGDLSMVLEAEGPTRRYFYRADGTWTTDRGWAGPARDAVRSHRARRQTAAGLGEVAENVGHWLTETQQRFDLALAAISALLVGGVIFNSFGLASWVFASSATTAWTLWFIGFGLWMFALAVFFTFMNHPAPRHGIRR